MKLISEDNRESSNHAELYDVIYGNKNVIFAKGGKFVRKELRSVLKESKNEDIIAYMDVVPDNLATIGIYIATCMEFLKYMNVYILPIPCIEYVKLRMLQINDKIKDNSIINVLDGSASYKDLRYCKKSKTYERACKALYGLYENRDKHVFSNILFYRNKLKTASDFLCLHKSFMQSSIISTFYNTEDISYSEALASYNLWFQKVCHIMNLSDQPILLLNSLLREINGSGR